jgi:ABC-2 type transport system permease protein
MSFKSIYTIFLKDLKTAINDKTILMIIVIPILVSLALPILMAQVGNMTASVAVYDEGNNSAFVSYMESQDIYNVTTVNSMKMLNETIINGDASAAVIVPANFSDDLEKGIRPSMEIWINPTKTDSVIFSSTYKEVLMNFTNQQFPINIKMGIIGTTENGGGASLLSSTGLIPMVILLTTVLLGISILPYTLTTEKEKKTLDAILVSPASEKDVIYGKMLFGLGLTMAVSLLVLAVNNGFAGDPIATVLFTLLGSTAFVGIGLLIGSYSNTYMSASVISSIVMLPLIMIPSFAALSDTVAMIAQVLPSTYMYNGLSDSMYGNGTMQGTLTGLAVLLAFNVAIYALTIYMVRKRRNMA